MPTDETTHAGTSKVLGEYDEVVGRLDRQGTSYVRLIETLLSRKRLKVHSLGFRVKDRRSLSEKCRIKEHKYAQLSDVTDVVGIRIITLFEDDVDTVGAIIRQEFKVDRKNSVDKRQQSSPDQFGYRSLHFVCTFSEARSELPEYSDYSTVPVEIQVRSILQHAWAEIEHGLGYKRSGDIPDALQRPLFRIAGLLELADEEFVRARTALEDYRLNAQEVVQSSDDRKNSLPTNADTLVEFINTEFVTRLDQQIADELQTTFRAELRGGAGARGRMAEWSQVLRAAGLDSIGDVERELVENGLLVVRFAVASNRLYYPSVTDDSSRLSIDSVVLPRGVSIWFVAVFTLISKQIAQLGDEIDSEDLQPAFPYPIPRDVLRNFLLAYSSIF